MRATHGNCALKALKALKIVISTPKNPALKDKIMEKRF